MAIPIASAVPFVLVLTQTMFKMNNITPDEDSSDGKKLNKPTSHLLILRPEGKTHSRDS